MAQPFVPILHGRPSARPDDAETLNVAHAIAEACGRLGFATEIIMLDLDLGPIEALAARRPLAVFNLHEGARGNLALSVLACLVMEHFALPFTGTGSRGMILSTSKRVTKTVCRAHDLPHAEAWGPHDRVPPDVTVIIKSDMEHASFGMDSGSVVAGHAAHSEMTRREATFATAFYAERFLPGREFNVGLLETASGVEVLPIPEIKFTNWPEGRPKIVDYEAKWATGSHAEINTARRFGLDAAEPAHASAIRALCLRTWAAFDLSGYARIDLREDEAGHLHVLEVNANPSLAPDAGFAAAAQEAGFGYDSTVAAIIDTAARRAA